MCWSCSNKNGRPHIRRRIPMGDKKKCPCCKMIKPFSSFYNNKNAPDNRGTYCIECCKLKHSSNPQRLANRQRERELADQGFSSEELANEIWKPVIGWEGIYSVSNLGRLRRDSGGERIVQGRILRGMSVLGYRVIDLRHKESGIKRKVLIHRLVVENFIGTIQEGLFVNHKNGIKHDNRVENLEIVTREENIAHAVKNKLHAFGERSGTAKLKKSQVDEIRKRYSEGGISQRILGLEYGLTRSGIQGIVNNRSWKDQ